MSMSRSRGTPLNIVVIGGSLSGLMCAITLKNVGHNVTVLEKDDDERQSHMAGLCLGADARELLERHDRIAQPFTFHSERLQLLNEKSKVSLLVKVARDVTSWDALYYRLRANFDGYSSTYYPEPPRVRELDGAARYLSKTRVLDISTIGSDTKLDIYMEDCTTMTAEHIEADIVIGADGPRSIVRQKYLPTCNREYVGYIVWRGIVPETALSQRTLAMFSKDINVFMKARQHCLAYTIPGDNGSLNPGERFINFAWYTNETEASLESIMLDNVSGEKHHFTVPVGHLCDTVWQAQVRRGREMPFPEPFLEVLNKITNPFVQVITDYNSDSAVFENGKVFLVGDGLTLLRPHTAFSASHAAFHALNLAAHLEGKLDVKQYEERVLRFGWLHSVQSRWFGSFYQASILRATTHAVQYWFARVLEITRAWWLRDEVLLRTPE